SPDGRPEASTKGRADQRSPLVPGTRVRMQVPPGAQAGVGFHGFMWPEGASIVVMELPGPYSEISTSFTAYNLGKQGMTLMDTAPVDVSGYAGVLLDVKQ